MKTPGLKSTAALYAVCAAVAYYLGYRLYALDREIIYTWINVIHYISPAQIILIIIASTAIAYYLSKRTVSVEHHIPLLLVLAAAATVPFLGATQPESDFIEHYDAARYIQTHGIIEGVKVLDEQVYKTPLLPILHALAYMVFGEGFNQAEMLQRIFYVLLPVLVYLIGRELWRPEVGFHAGLLTLATPSILQQNYLLMQDIPVTFLTALTVYLMLRGFKDGRYYVFAAMSALFTLLTKLNGLIFIVVTVIPIWALKRESERKKKTLARSDLLLVLITMLVTLSLIILPSFREVILKRAQGIVSNYAREFLSLSSAIPITSVFYQMGFAQAMLTIPAVVYALRRRDRNSLLLASWIMIPVAILWGKRIRYLMPILPAVSLLIASGLAGADERLRKTLIYSTALIMLSITLYVTPQIVGDYVFNNIMHAATATNSLDVKTVGVYTDFTYPWMREAPLVSAVDYYSNRRIMYVGDADAGRRSSHRRHYVIPAMYMGGNSTREHLDALITSNYTLLREWKGGVYYYHNPYYVRLYLRKEGRGGSADAIIYASNVDRMQGVHHDFWFKSKNKRHDQEYTFGPIRLASYYGTHIDDWLGERQILVKPPDEGQMNVSKMVKVPEYATLSFSVSLRPDTWHPLKGDGVRFRVYASNEKTTRLLLDEYIDPKNEPADRKLHQHRIKLSEFTDTKTTFTFQTMSGPAGSSMYDTAGFGNPAILASPLA